MIASTALELFHSGKATPEVPLGRGAAPSGSRDKFLDRLDADQHQRFESETVGVPPQPPGRATRKVLARGADSRSGCSASRRDAA
jgi:hypothetical protein